MIFISFSLLLRINCDYKYFFAHGLILDKRSQTMDCFFKMCALDICCCEHALWGFQWDFKSKKLWTRSVTSVQARSAFYSWMHVTNTTTTEKKMCVKHRLSKIFQHFQNSLTKLNRLIKYRSLIKQKWKCNLKARFQQLHSMARNVLQFYIWSIELYRFHVECQN